MGNDFPDKSKAAYSLFNALSRTHISALICGFSILQEVELLVALMSNAASTTEIIGSLAFDTNSNSIIIGAYLRGKSLPQLNHPLNGLNETVFDSPAGTETY
jgi:hypothetical protein